MPNKIKKFLKNFGNAYFLKTANNIKWSDSHNNLVLKEPLSTTSMICNRSFFDYPFFQYWMNELHENVFYHRKQWEIVYVAQALYERGMLNPGKKGVVFGVGTESLPSLFISKGCDILATDLSKENSASKQWINTKQHISNNIKELNYPNICDEKTFIEHISYQDVDMNSIPEDIVNYDFCWSTCAFEHLGSIRNGLDFVKNSLKTLKPGGIAVHTTEYNLSSNDKTLESEYLSIFRKQDIELLIKELEADGHYVYPMDWNLGSNIIDNYIDLPPYQFKVHLRLEIDKYVTTSIGLIIQKR